MSLISTVELLESARDKKVLYLGETIEDEYIFVSPMAKPSKENILAVRFQKSELYEGGVLAAFNHARTFCDAAKLTMGNKIRKTRYVEENYQRKLFEIQYIQDGEAKGLLPDDIFSRFNTLAVADFGHCMFSPPIVEQICTSDKFVCISTQTNAHNAGYNLITKYSRADYICIDEPEARLAAADRYSPLEKVIEKIAGGRCQKIIVTHGRHGAYGWHEGRFVHKPTFSERPIDTMGAGDAFFAITAPIAQEGSIEDLLMIGNAAGTLKTQILGHRESVTKNQLIEFLKARWN